jgi:hypothetical protein
MKKFVNFLGYVPVLLVVLLGAYIVFHMWHLSERFRHKDSPGARQSERMAAGNTQSVLGANSEEAKAAISPSQE